MLRPSTRLAWDAWQAAVGNNAITPVDVDAVTRLFACSSFAAEQACRQTQVGFDFFMPAADGQSALSSREELAKRVNAVLAGIGDEAELMATLRQLRNREYLRIVWCDINRSAAVDEILVQLSDLADTIISCALTWLEADHRQKWGVPRNQQGEPQSLVVLGMGKLGGHELNFSSDVDLIFAFLAAGGTDAARPLDNEQFFIRLAQRLIKVLAEPTIDGFVYRVDTRLRPFGDAGALVFNFSAMVSYYENHGREWERYALIKARPVAGDLAAGEALLESLRPFVFRRYLDYGAIESLREMKLLIARQVEQKGMKDNIKLGAGGIREIEFIGQLFQLIRGGQERVLRQRSLLPVLDHLGRQGVLPAQSARDLADAYRFLRRVENRIQQVADQQTHELPRDEPGRARLALGLDYPDWASLILDLDKHRLLVHEEFAKVFAGTAESPSEVVSGDLALLWSGTMEPAAACQALQQAGYSDADQVLMRLINLGQASLYRKQTEAARQRLDRLMPLLIVAAGRHSEPEQTLGRVLQVIEAVIRRSTYLALLAEHPTALNQLVRLCGASPWITDYLTQHPALLDEMLDLQRLSHPLSRQELVAELGVRLAESPDLDQRMDILRRFKQVHILRVAAADLFGHLPLMKVSDHLTELAEVIVSTVLDMAWTEMAARYGRPRCFIDGHNYLPKMAIVAYGKLGGLELSYGSDLDLVFLHDSGGEQQITDGAKSVDNAVFFARVVQRMMHVLTARTPSGILYEIDTRLRPSGGSGVLVSSVQGFADYQDNQAWTWEHQALVRARGVAGEPGLLSQFNEIRRRVLCRSRDAAVLRGDIGEMREKMRSHLDGAGGGNFDLKQGQGGIADIEFMVQYGVLRWAHDYPEVQRYPDNIRQLEALAEHKLWPEEDCRRLTAAYLALRAKSHELALQSKEAVVDDEALVPWRQWVVTLWRRHLGTSDG